MRDSISICTLIKVHERGRANLCPRAIVQLSNCVHLLDFIVNEKLFPFNFPYIYSQKFHTIFFYRDLEIIDKPERAPDPKLEVSVRQGGKPIAGDLHVSPGTPLSMEIYLDDLSAPVYGLGVTHMQVTDTNTQEETIIFNG